MTDTTTTPTEPKDSILHTHINPDLHQALRVRAVTNGLTIRAAITEAIEAWVNGDNPGGR